jgi:aryl-alcohol dehydrogenase-like predicted oxidoreductase
VTSPIIGANTPEQLKDSLGALPVRLTAAEKESLEKLTAWEEPEEE